MHISILVCLLVIFLSSAPAQALLITLEPDDYVLGTNVTNLFNGVSLHTYTSTSPRGSATLEPVYISNTSLSYIAPTGTQVFSGPSNAFNFGFVHEAALCWSATCPTYQGFNALLVQFEAPVNYFEVAFGMLSDPGEIWAFGADRQPLGRCEFQDGCSSGGSYTIMNPDWRTGITGTLQFSTAEPAIHSVLMAGDSGWVRLDRITYNTVPEPPGVILLAVGLLLLIVMFPVARLPAENGPPL